MRTYATSQHYPKGVKLHVWSVRIAASDPHFAGAFIGLTGGIYGGGKGDTATVIAMEMAGNWSIITGPGTGMFLDVCGQHNTARPVAQLICHY